MRKFVLKSLIFTIFFLCLVVFLDYLSTKEKYRFWFADLTDSRGYIEGNVGAAEILPYIKKVQEKDDSHILIVGDSVSHQLFNNLNEYNPDCCIVGSNGAITAAGQYILVNEYFKNHNQVSDVYLLFLHESFVRTFDTKWGYQYVVMPFAETNTLNELDEDTIDILRHTYGDVFLNPKVVKAIDDSAVNRKIYLNSLAKISKGYSQNSKYELAEKYISKIKNLCDENGAEFHLLACPTAEYKKQEIEDAKEEWADSWLGINYPDFLENVYFYPDEQSADHTHFSGDYANQDHYNEIINLAFGQTELIDEIKFHD